MVKVPRILGPIEGLNNLAFIDLETDGLSPDKNNILQVAIITNNEDHTLNKWVRYVLPKHYTSEKDNQAYHINKIGWDKLKNAKSIMHYWPTIKTLLKDRIVIGYNIHKFDLPFINYHARLDGYELEYSYSIDLYPATWKKRQGQKLIDALNLYKIPLTNAHDALGDIEPCIELMANLATDGIIPQNIPDLEELIISPDNFWKDTRIVQKGPNTTELITPPGSQEVEYTKPVNKRVHTDYGIWKLNKKVRTKLG
jgi:DNA polymerase III alpha subunit (gram-positive type)